MRVGLVALAFTLAAASACSSLVLQAQSLPWTQAFAWDASAVDASHPSPTQYAVSLDGGTPQIVASSVCTPTCEASVVIPAAGMHTLSVVAQAPAFSPLPDSPLVSSDPATLDFRLNPPPAAPTNVRPKK